MALIKTIRGKTPQFGKNCFLADTATILGDVTLGDDCSLWFNVVLRGDVHFIRIGNSVNIQDNTTVHCTYQKAPTTIGNSVSIGHNAVVHGCTIEDHVLIGMGAIIMDGAVVETNCIVAAGALVLEKMILEKGHIYAGVPARKIKAISPEAMTGTIERIARDYKLYASWYQPDRKSVV